jgi:hypothetical protein
LASLFSFRVGETGSLDNFGGRNLLEGLLLIVLVMKTCLLSKQMVRITQYLKSVMDGSIDILRCATPCGATMKFERSVIIKRAKWRNISPLKLNYARCLISGSWILE